MRSFTLAVLAILVSAFCLNGPVFAQTTPIERGLVITPPRQYIEVEPGKTTKSSLTVVNSTEAPVDITLSYEQFSVADYTYDYQFMAPKEAWISLETTSVQLKRTESRTISYDIAAPHDAQPGGHYFTLLASMSRGDGKVVRAATVVYVTVKGDLKKDYSIVNHFAPWLSTGSDVPYSFDVLNTGNTHFLVYVSGELKGVSAKEKTTEAAHILLPGKIRKVEGRIPSPLLPGFYQATYGFKDEDGHETTRSQLILHAPLWSWALVVGVIWLGVTAVRYYRVRKP